MQFSAYERRNGNELVLIPLVIRQPDAAAAKLWWDANLGLNYGEVIILPDQTKSGNVAFVEA